MEITSVPFLNQEDFSYFNSFFQDLDANAQTLVNNKRKLDEFDQQNNFLNEKAIPNMNFQMSGSASEIPNWDFENRAPEMVDWELGMPGKAINPSPAVYHNGETSPEGGGQQRRMWMKQRSKAWWEYHDSDRCSDNEFRKTFRMSKATFNMLCEELDSAVTKKNTMLRMAIPVRQRVAVCIYRLATGDPLRAVADMFGIGISTCHKLVLEVCTAIKNVIMPKYLHWPDEERLQEIKTTFGTISGIPNVIGSMYTTHISMVAPKTNQEVYYNARHTERNQKPSYSMTVQGLVDPRGMFIDVCIGYPGSLTDEQILEQSALTRRSNLGTLENAWVVGNSGYPLKDWILVPYTHQNLTWSQHAFNQRLGEIEMIAKDAFMRLKGRWGCLQKRAEMKLEELPMVLGTCCVLHNICEMFSEELDVGLRFDLHDDEMEVDASRGISVNAFQARETIAHNLLHHNLGN